ncbi:hypothetical protein BE15_36070 [Sorangium cellulosum]|uniref:Uncharacterized protein n=1 Tax=Sorangium cellulosum TaxID=56 RepID=A0A150QNA0_SORCE|nr:hypothetical protein BE15_36070 [Sorangium cellulosum]
MLERSPLRHPRLNILGWSLALSLLLVAPPALGVAPPGGARLSYARGPGAEGCPDEQVLRDVVAAQLGGTDPFVDGGGRHVEVVLSRKGRHFLAEIALYDADGRRLGGQELTNAACGALVEDVGTALAIVLRPARSAREPAPPPPASPPPVSSEPADPAPVAASLPAPEVSPRAPGAALAPPCQPCQPAPPARPVERPGPSLAWPRFHVGLGALIARGLASAPAVGFSASMGARWEAFSLSLEGGWHLPVAAEPYRGRTFGVSWLGGSVVPCGHAAWFFGCAIVTAGRVRHVGMVNVTGELKMLYAGLGLRGGLEVPISPHLAAQLSGELLANVSRPALNLAGGLSLSSTATSTVGALRLVASF